MMSRKQQTNELNVVNSQVSETMSYNGCCKNNMENIATPTAMAFVMDSIRFVALFIFSTFCLFNPQEAVAQSRIKLAKNIVYEGEVVNQQPHGRGTLSIVYPNLPNANKVLEISGTFEGYQITDAEVRSDGFRCDGMDSLYFPTITYAVYTRKISVCLQNSLHPKMLPIAIRKI